MHIRTGKLQKNHYHYHYHYHYYHYFASRRRLFLNRSHCVHHDRAWSLVPLFRLPD
ncbi:hypothetical protein LZ32DRAFT_607342 [Colletotrichum eremochloae]|nr:hypothetical protein LZ32DRAFT_607342 [Colletotrichum eremochloae]